MNNFTVLTRYELKKLFQKKITCPFPSSRPFAVIVLIAVAFTVLTFVPPHIPLFQDPITGTYGFQ